MDKTTAYPSRSFRDGLRLSHHRVLALAVLLLFPVKALGQNEASPTPWWELGLSDPILDETVVHYLGQTWFQGADIGEVLETVARVSPDDPQDWSRQWRLTAERLAQVGQTSEAEQHPISASHAYLRAATYYRAALHRHMEAGGPEVEELAAREVHYFERYLALSHSPCRPVRIPYEDTTLPGYFCRSPQVAFRAPVVIFHSGRDAWAEDGKFIADEALKRGYHALLLDGPGQGKTLRLQGLAFRHDWEQVVSAVLDFVVKRRCVDRRRLVLWGESMGGYLAARAAAHEPRIRALVLNPGVLNWRDVVIAQIDELFPDLLELQGDDAALNAAAEEIMAQSDFARWAFADTLWKHGVDTIADLLRDLELYQLDGAEQAITADTLVVDAELDPYGQARALYEALPGARRYLRFTTAEAAPLHVQSGAKAIGSQRIFDWLDDLL